MYAVELDRSKRLLVISAAQKVTAEEAKMVAQRIHEVLQDVAPGFRVLADFRGLESMDSGSGATHRKDHGRAGGEKRRLRYAGHA